MHRVVYKSSVVKASMPGKRKRPGYLRKIGPYSFEVKRSRTGGLKRRGKFSRIGGKGKFRKMVKKIVLATAEKKFVDSNFAKVEHYHQAGSNVSTVTPDTNFVTSSSLNWPQIGDGKHNRTGDHIYLSGIRIEVMMGMKADRPNVTFRHIIYTSKIGVLSIASLLDVTTGNWALDAHRNDSPGRILLDRRFTTPKHNTGLFNANKETTFFRKYWIPMKRQISFTDGASLPNAFDNIFIATLCYDAFGTLTTDNIAYSQMYSRLYFRDP